MKNKSFWQKFDKWLGWFGVISLSIFLPALIFITFMPRPSLDAPYPGLVNIANNEDQTPITYRDVYLTGMQYIEMEKPEQLHLDDKSTFDAWVKKKYKSLDNYLYNHQYEEIYVFNPNNQEFLAYAEILVPIDSRNKIFYFLGFPFVALHIFVFWLTKNSKLLGFKIGLIANLLSLPAELLLEFYPSPYTDVGIMLVLRWLTWAMSLILIAYFYLRFRAVQKQTGFLNEP